MHELLDTLVNLSKANWGGVAALLVALCIGLGALGYKRKAALNKARNEAWQEYLEALNHGTAEAIMLAKDKCRKLGLLCFFLLSISIGLTGCVKTTYIPVGDYVIFPKAGDVVPNLPNGEARWLLLSAPTGTQLILNDKGPK